MVFRSASAVAALVMLAAGSARAQLPMPASTQFDIVGEIQEATLDPTCTASPRCGGLVKVQGHTIVVPKETIVLFPANAMFWQEVFALAPAPYGLAGVQANGAVGETGLALNDLPAPLINYEVHVVGNRVLGGPGGADLYIAGLVNITSHALNVGAGFINFIDLTLGEIRVGGVLGDPTTGARVRINDPTGRFGRTTTSPDVRFGVDPENPTIMAATGFPMCLPRTVADDPLCPQAQRPLDPLGNPQVAITTNDPTVPGLLGVPPDANVQAPLEVGDYIFFSGIIVTDNAAAPTAGPWPVPGSTAGTYVAAWSITNNVGIWTAPGTNPAYIMVDVALMGTGGLSVLGVGEAVIRTRFEGMTSDQTRTVHLSGVDFAPLTGAISDRDYGTILPDPGPPAGAVKGRWRFRPPCAAFGTVPAKPDKQCVMNQANTFLPPPREVRAVLQGAWTAAAPLLAANGITTGQYRNPSIEYIFPENLPGTPIVENNFNTIDFLALGGYPSSTGLVSGVLNPWPSSVIPIPACVAPTANAGGPYTVAAGGTVTLAGSSTGTAPVTLLWAVSSGSVTPNNVGNGVFSAIGATSPVTATLSATNACGTASASATITISAALQPTVNHVLPITLFSGAPGTLPVTGTDPNVPAQALTFTAVQTGAPALVNLQVTSTGPSSANITFTAPVLPVGQVLPSTINLTLTATNTGGAVSLAEFTTVTVQPLPDAVTVTSAQYRLGKQRLDITASSSVVSPNVVLTLQPYLTINGTTFTPPAATFTNTGGGLYTITVVGGPEPAIAPAKPIIVKSNIGGTSPATGITVRQ
ncbi:MAG: hypothetical protein E6J61_04675 [Deltaproteobacteria bacterium]|nr:MAG: hypothetical protein E6J61_04675 [Deltaproteobacteria bacterium]